MTGIIYLILQKYYNVLNSLNSLSMYKLPRMRVWTKMVVNRQD